MIDHLQQECRAACCVGLGAAPSHGILNGRGSLCSPGCQGLSQLAITSVSSRNQLLSRFWTLHRFYGLSQPPKGFLSHLLSFDSGVCCSAEQHISLYQLFGETTCIKLYRITRND